MRENFNLKWNKKKGFTVIELVVVIVLMSILALIFIPNLTAYGSKADDSKILANMKGVHTSAELVKQTDQKLDKDKIAKLSNNDNISLEIVKDLDRVYDIYYVEQQSDTIVVKYLDRNNKLHVFPKELANYTISFDTDGGNSIPEITQIYGSKITKPEDPKKKGKVFEGWKPSVPSKMPMENTTIKAKWSTQRVTAIFNPNEGVVSPEFITVDYGEKVALPTPTRLLYVFTGWYTALEDGSKVTSIESLENDVTLYARWRLDNIITKVKPAGTTSSTQVHKIPLDGVKNVDSVKVTSPNGGVATVVSIGENEITVRVTGATTHNRSIQTGGVYTPVDNKVITDTRKSQGTNTNPSSIAYNSGGYSGTLTKGETETDTVQTGGSYTPSDSKTATDTRTSYGSNSNPSSVSYSSGGYSGNLTKGETSTSSYQTGGSYTPADSMYVSGQTSSWYNSGGYSGSLDSYVYSGSYTPAESKTATDYRTGYYQYYWAWVSSTQWGPKTLYRQGGVPFPNAISYYSGGFSGTLYKSGGEQYLRQETSNWDRSSPGSSAYATEYYQQNYSGTVTKPASDTREWRYAGTVTRPASDTRTYGTAYTSSYSGTITKPAVDTRTYETSYTSKYSGTVTKPATDTRTYDNYYDYELEIDYNKGY